MVMRLAVLRAIIGMRQDGEAQLGILVQHLALRCAFRDVLRDELAVLQNVLHQSTDSLAALGARLPFQRVMTLRGELFDRSAHGVCLLFASVWIAVRTVECDVEMFGKHLYRVGMLFVGIAVAGANNDATK